MTDGPLPFRPKRPHAFPPSQRLAPGLGDLGKEAAQAKQRARVALVKDTGLTADRCRALGLKTLAEIASDSESDQARVQAAARLLEVAERGEEVPPDASTVEALIPYLARHGYEIVKRPGQAS
jgi:hypothetical protein